MSPPFELKLYKSGFEELKRSITIKTVKNLKGKCEVKTPLMNQFICAYNIRYT